MLLDRFVRNGNSASRSLSQPNDHELQDQEALQGDTAVIHCLEELNLLRGSLQNTDKQNLS